MQKSIVLVVALVAMQGRALFAQSLVGTWQGLMQVSQAPGDTLRVVFKISTTVGGSLKGDMYSIDQGGQAPAPDVTLKGSAVRIAMPDRFRLKFHREKRDLSVYAIVVGKTGAKLTISEGDPKGDPNMFFYGFGKFIAKNTTIADFAGFLQQGVVDRPVVDQTGLAGRYDFGMVYRPDQPLVGGPGVNPPPPNDADALDDIYAAVQQQLGLRLEATKTSTDVIVIDHLEKPSEN